MLLASVFCCSFFFHFPCSYPEPSLLTSASSNIPRAAGFVRGTELYFYPMICAGVPISNCELKVCCLISFANLWSSESKLSAHVQACGFHRDPYHCIEQKFATFALNMFSVWRLHIWFSNSKALRNRSNGLSDLSEDLFHLGSDWKMLGSDFSHVCLEFCFIKNCKCSKFYWLFWINSIHTTKPIAKTLECKNAKKSAHQKPFQLHTLTHTHTHTRTLSESSGEPHFPWLNEIHELSTVCIWSRCNHLTTTIPWKEARSLRCFTWTNMDWDRFPTRAEEQS